MSGGSSFQSFVCRTGTQKYGPLVFIAGGNFLGRNLAYESTLVCLDEPAFSMAVPSLQRSVYTVRIHVASHSTKREVPLKFRPSGYSRQGARSN